MSDAAQTLGQRLKAERERRGMSTQKAADEMHLDAWVIDALEAGDYARIGPTVYAKGHLKKYASILGLSPTEIVSGYDTPSAAPVVNTALQPAGMRMRSTAPDATTLPWAQIGVFAAIAIVIGGIFWWQPWRHRSAAHSGVALSRRPPSAAAAIEEQDTERSAEPQRSDTASPELAAAAASVATADANAGPAAVLPTPAAAPIPAVLSRSGGTPSDAESTLGVGPARLRLSFSADSWVDVHDAAGRRVYAGNGRANSVKTITGIAPLKVYLGFASGVQLEVNDHAVAIGPQFVSGDVARFEAGADGILRRDSHALPTNGVPSRNASPRG
jgi:cytoskeleton protein RodZ